MVITAGREVSGGSVCYKSHGVLPISITLPSIADHSRTRSNILDDNLCSKTMGATNAMFIEHASLRPS